MVEQAAVNRKVEGSSPSLGANFFQIFSRLYKLSAGVAELADAQDLKSCDPYRSYRFDPGLRHQFIFGCIWKSAGIIYKDLEYTIIDIAG